jgi:hypothetical protein
MNKSLTLFTATLALLSLLAVGAYYSTPLLNKDY